MRVLLWLLRAVIFFLLLGFAVQNSGEVTLRFFFDHSWQLPLVVVMLISFVAGAALGLVAALGSYLRQRREILELKRKAEQASTPTP